MTWKIFRDGLIVLGVFAFCWFLFSKISSEKEVNATHLPPDKLEVLSDWLAKEIEKTFHVMDDHPWEASMQEMKERLEDGTPSDGQGFIIKVVDQSMPNAFATLGHRIYVFKGLIEICDTPEELYAVLAHEVGHIVHNHVEKRLLTEFSLAILFGAMTGGDLILAGEIIRSLSSGAFSRTQERQADDFALELMVNTGVDPRNLGVIFRKLKDYTGDPSMQFEMLSTHPDIRKRIKKALEYDNTGLEIRSFETPWPTSN